MEKVKTLDQQNLPAGGALIVPSQLCRPLDISRLEQILDGRELAYVVEHSHGILDPELLALLEGDARTALMFSTDPSTGEEMAREVKALTGEGKLVVLVTGTIPARAGSPIITPADVMEFVLGLGVPTVPLFVDHPRDARLSIDDPGEMPEAIFAFGELLEGGELILPILQERLFLAGSKCFDQRPSLRLHLAYAILRGVSLHGSASTLIDGVDKSETSYQKLLAGAIALSGVLKKETDKPRIGIILPPGRAGLVANMAALLAGKVPVNLNFTAGKAAVESAIRQADLDRFVTADPFVRKMSAFPWPPTKRLLFIERIAPTLKKKATMWFILSKFLSPSLLARVLGVPKEGGDKEAVLLFTSGSSGDPKGVVLTHRNIVGNVTQFGTRIDLSPQDSVLGCLPLFHSFGATVTMWYPLLEGLALVTYPSPLETAKLADLIEKHSVDLLAATPTFLRGYMRKVNPRKLDTLKLVVSGAEKLPSSFAAAFKDRFGKNIMEGYGLTETSPVSNVNIPDPEPSQGDESGVVSKAWRQGSVGQMLPGLAIRMTNADTDEQQSIHTTGIIWFRGVNIFPGYLNEPKKTAEVLTEDGWFKTGDLGRVDRDGFLYIEGRLSRFSKIGGEMVPHETVEEYLIKMLRLEGENERKLAVVGLPDERKGESLVLLCSLPGQDMTDLRYRLLEIGVPTLWIPKVLKEVEDIPVLASGKLDIKKCERIAKGE